MLMNCFRETQSRSKSGRTNRSNNRSKLPCDKLETIDTPKVPVRSTYYGVMVTEDYRWLEDARSDQTRSWTKWLTS